VWSDTSLPTFQRSVLPLPFRVEEKVKQATSKKHEAERETWRHTPEDSTPPSHSGDQLISSGPKLLLLRPNEQVATETKLEPVQAGSAGPCNLAPSHDWNIVTGSADLMIGLQLRDKRRLTRKAQ
jgi:hypothetical protein